MNSVGKMTKNWWTTLAGIIGAVIIYINGVGGKVPETSQEWLAFWMGLSIAVIGVFAKDATTGSGPEATK